VIVSIFDVGIALLGGGVLSGWRIWHYLGSDRQVTRSIDESIRGGRFTGKSEQDRPEMIRNVRRVFAILMGVCVLMTLAGSAILVKGLVH
jgi:hypothetical protein